MIDCFKVADVALREESLGEELRTALERLFQVPRDRFFGRGWRRERRKGEERNRGEPVCRKTKKSASNPLAHTVTQCAGETLQEVRRMDLQVSMKGHSKKQKKSKFSLPSARSCGFNPTSVSSVRMTWSVSRLWRVRSAFASRPSGE